MPLSPEQALALQRSRRLQVRPVPDGWVAETARGERLHRGSLPTQEAAIEAAEATLVATEARNEETRAGRVLAALARGRYSLRPRLMAATDPVTGQPVQRRVFDAYRLSGTPILEVQGRESYVQAVLDTEALLGP